MTDGTTGLVDATSDSSNINFYDHSNYDEGVEDGHAQADFDFKKLVLESRDGYSYTLSTEGDGEGSVGAPKDAASLPIAHNIPHDEDRVYTLTLIVVPTYDAAVAYSPASEHCVYYQGTLYECIQAGTGQTPGAGSSYWTAVEEADLPTKYRVQVTMAVTYYGVEWYNKYVLALTEKELAVKDFNPLMDLEAEYMWRIFILLRGVDYHANDDNWEMVDILIAKMKIYYGT